MRYVRWTPELAAVDGELRSEVESFEPLDFPAAHEASEWLKERSLTQFPGVTTWLLMSERLEGFVSLRMSEVELHREQREKLGKDHASQGAILIVWIARHRESEIELDGLLVPVMLLAQRTRRDVGAVAIAADPYDKSSKKLWRAADFSSTRTRVGSGSEPKTRLWLPLPDLRLDE